MPNSQQPPSIDGFLVNARPDIPDIRDWPYKPALIQLKSQIKPPTGLTILDQGQEGACTGFGLAAVVNYLNQCRKRPVDASARMLYEMAKVYDEWEGEDYSGSSLRGAIKGFYNTGVCSDDEWPYVVNNPGNLTMERAKAARENTIGAYYRIKHRVSDFHAALNEVEVIYVSADVHEGWQASEITQGVIPFKRVGIGGHAFAVVGYNEKGFWVQNSWGRGWGNKGVALWTYEDWLENIKDAWVLRLALPTPQIWHQPPSATEGTVSTAEARQPIVRTEIAGHFVHLDDGDFHTKGKYWSNSEDVKETAKLVAGNEWYEHLLFYAHGGLNTIDASAKRIRSMKNVFMDNKIYPFHFMYDTGIMEELKDVIFRKRDKSVDRVSAFSDASDWLLEKLTRVPGRALWREMKRGGKSPFSNLNNGGSQVLQHFNSALSGRDSFGIHLAGHSTGAILCAYLLGRLNKESNVPRISTVSLLAPAGTVNLFEKQYVPLLQAAESNFGIDKMTVYNLSDKLERDDNVGKVYRKSLLYLVSRAFEEEKKEEILGMQRFSKDLDPLARLEFVYSKGPNGDEPRSHSDSHGGFDNDVATMNELLCSVLGLSDVEKLTRPFTSKELDY